MNGLPNVTIISLSGWSSTSFRAVSGVYPPAIRNGPFQALYAKSSFSAASTSESPQMRDSIRWMWAMPIPFNLLITSVNCGFGSFIGVSLLPLRGSSAGSDDGRWKRKSARRLSIEASEGGANGVGSDTDYDPSQDVVERSQPYKNLIRYLHRNFRGNKNVSCLGGGDDHTRS